MQLSSSLIKLYLVNSFPTYLLIITRDNINSNEIYLNKNGKQEDENTSKNKIIYKSSPPTIVTLTKKEVGEHLDYASRKIDRIDQESGDRFLVIDLPKIMQNIKNVFSSFSLIMVDIDELTIINKVFGAEVGNHVLLNVSTILSDESEMEFVGRCGDDTYYIFLPGLQVTEARKIAEDLRLKIQYYEWRNIADSLKVTCSFGISEIDKDEPVRDWIVRAACGMIYAKEAGRNRTTFGPNYLSAKASRSLRSYYSGSYSITYPEGNVSFPFE